MICDLTQLEIDWLVDYYTGEDMPWTVDNMVDTPEERAMCEAFCRLTDRPFDLHWFHEKMVELRKHKSRIVPKKGPRRQALPEILAKHKSFLVKEYRGQDIALDHLPHTMRFEEMATAFRKRFHLSWSNHEIFCHYLNIRKSGELGRKPRDEEGGGNPPAGPKPSPMPLFGAKVAAKPA